MGRVGKFQGFCFSFFLAKGLKEHVIAYNTYIYTYIYAGLDTKIRTKG